MFPDRDDPKDMLCLQCGHLLSDLNRPPPIKVRTPPKRTYTYDEEIDWDDEE